MSVKSNKKEITDKGVKTRTYAEVVKNANSQKENTKIEVERDRKISLIIINPVH